MSLRSTSNNKLCWNDEILSNIFVLVQAIHCGYFQWPSLFLLSPLSLHIKHCTVFVYVLSKASNITNNNHCISSNWEDFKLTVKMGSTGDRKSLVSSKEWFAQKFKHRQLNSRLMQDGNRVYYRIWIIEIWFCVPEKVKFGFLITR